MSAERDTHVITHAEIGRWFTGRVFEVDPDGNYVITVDDGDKLRLAFGPVYDDEGRVVHYGLTMSTWDVEGNLVDVVQTYHPGEDLLNVVADRVGAFDHRWDRP